MEPTTKPCPKCRASGGDRTGNNLTTFPDGGSYCFACKEVGKPSWMVKGKLASQRRGISDEVFRFMNYRIGQYTGSVKDRKTNQYRDAVKEKCHVITWLDQRTRQPYRQQLRFSDKAFKTLGDKNHDLDLYGITDYTPTDKLFCVITEGAIDRGSVITVMGIQYPVVSLPNGAASAVKTLKKNYDWLLQWKYIVLAYDADKDGQNAQIESSKLFEPDKIRLCNWPSGFKDANEMLQAGEGEAMKRAIWNAQTPAMENIVTAGDLIDELGEAPQFGIDLPWQSMNDIMYGLRMCEITTFVGPTGCVDADTEFMTPTGWKRIAEYSAGEPVLQYNVDGTSNFTVPFEYIKLPCDHLTSIQSKYGVSQILCDEHTFIYVDKRNPRKLISKPFAWIKSRWGKFSGKIITTFDPPNRPGICLTDNELRVMVAVNADGYVQSVGTRRTCINIKKRRKQLRLQTLLKAANIDFYIQEKKNGYQSYKFYAPRLKGYDNEYYSATAAQLEIINKEVVLWDGDCKNTFRTTVKSSADFIQYVFAACGYRSSLNPSIRYDKGHVEYRLTRTLRNKITGVNASAPKPYKTVDGFKYCFTVSSGMLILRNRNQIFITGNCGKTEIIKDIVSSLLDRMNVAVFSFEQKPKETLRRYIGAQLGLKLQKPGTEYPVEKIKKIGLSYDNKLFLYKVTGRVTAKDILRNIVYVAKAKGCKLIIIDNLKFLRVVMDKEACAEFAQTLKELVESLEIHIFLVSHVSKNTIRRSTHVGFSSLIPKGGKPHENLSEEEVKSTMNKFALDWEDGRQPGESDIEGGNDIAAVSDYIFSLGRNKRSLIDTVRRTINVVPLKYGRIDDEYAKNIFKLYREDSGKLLEIDYTLNNGDDTFDEEDLNE